MVSRKRALITIARKPSKQRYCARTWYICDVTAVLRYLYLFSPQGLRNAVTYETRGVRVFRASYIYSCRRARGVCVKIAARSTISVCDRAFLIALCSTVRSGRQPRESERAHGAKKPRAMRWRELASAYHSLTTRQQRKFAARKGLPRAGCLPSSVAGISFWTPAKSSCAAAFKDAALVRVCTARAHRRDPQRSLPMRAYAREHSAPASRDCGFEES